MEENNDFEKYDGHEESIETLLGTNEKSSSMTSRERVDDVLENEGADALSKFGVPKNLGKKAIKKDGGTFMPTHGPTQKMAKNYSRNKLAQGLDKIDEVKNGKKLGLNSKKNPTNSKNSDKTSNRINNAKNKRNIFSNRKFNGNKTNSEETESDQKQESKQSIKDKIGSKISGKNKTNTQGKVDSIVKQTISGFAKKALIAVAPYILGFLLLFVLIFFVIELILGPLMEAWGYIDEAVTGVANFSEKLTNFYNGFGFQDSKEAFYDELEDLCDKYTCSNDGSGLDVPLLLSTLFYTEGMGYDTSYGSIEDSDSIDVTSLGTPEGAFSAIKEWLREKYDESKETVDENGLTYNAGKIYRLRKLARNQFYTNSFGLTERRGQEKHASLSQFLEMYGKNIAVDISDMLKDLVGIVLKTLKGPFSEIYASAIGSKYAGEYFTDLANKAGDFESTFKTLISDVFYGLADITNIDIELLGDDGLLTVDITYREFQYDEDNYKKYLTNYYFENIPEFRSMLGGLTGDDRERKKEQLYNDIVSNKKLFEDIFLKNQSTSSENYVESCIGAINQNLVNNLNKPVDIAENFNVSFSDNYSYGVVNGKNHNGVDLNTTTAGVNLGSNVYSAANGKIVSIEDSNCNDKVCGKSIKISHDINVDNETFKFFTIYSNVDIKSGLKVDSTVVKGDTIGTINNSTDNTEGLHFTFLDANSNANGVAIDPTNLFITCNTGTLTGDSNEEKIWNYLLGLGYSKAGVSGVMGNWMQESGLMSNNVEDASKAQSLFGDEGFTSKVDDGSISKEEFIQSSKYAVPAGWHGYNYNGLTYGYGLAQWTDSGRKTNLYEFWKSQNVTSIGDLKMQLDFYKKEAAGYSGLNDALKNATSPEDAASKFVNIYEVGSAGSERKQNARNIYNKYANQ